MAGAIPPYMSKTPKTAKPSLYETIVARMIATIETGTVPWRKTWRGDSSAPRSAVTGRAYRGMNAIMLMCSSYASPHWLTFKQAADLGGNVRKGEKSTPCIYWTLTTKGKKREDGVDGEKEGGRMIPCPFWLFNVEQCDDLPADVLAKLKIQAREIVENQDAEELAQSYLAHGPSLRHGGDVACYSPTGDAINIPPRQEFDSDAHYYSTLFHEIGHSTGHTSRLNRDLLPLASKHSYSREELVAELCSAFLCAASGVSNEDTESLSAAYLASWAKYLRETPAKEIVNAAQAAQRGSDLVLGWSYAKEKTREEDVASLPASHPASCPPFAGRHGERFDASRNTNDASVWRIA